MAGVEMDTLVPVTVTDSVSATASPGVPNQSNDSDVESRLCGAPAVRVRGNHDTGNDETECFRKEPAEDGGNPLNPETSPSSEAESNESDGLWFRKVHSMRENIEHLKKEYQKRGSWDVVLLIVLREGPSPLQVHSSREKMELFANMYSCIDYLLTKCKADPNALRKLDGDTPLHCAARNSSVELTDMLLQHGAKPNIKNKRNKTPLALALEFGNDDNAARLIKSMEPEDVRNVFICQKGENRCQFNYSFRFLVSDRRTFKVSPIAVLDSLVKSDRGDFNPCYQFDLQVLDTDSNGRSSGDPGFHPKQTALHLIQEKQTKDMLDHVAVKVHIATKYKRYFGSGHWLTGSIFLLYFLVMTFALVAGGVAEDPTEYNKRIDYFRAICEILTLLFCCYQLGFETWQLKRLRSQYYKDVYNYADLTGFSLFIFVILPLRYTESPAQWTVAAVAYMIIGMRSFKYLRTSKYLADYTQILAKLVREDIVKFLVVFFIFLVTFSGSFFLALRGHVTSVSGSNGTSMTASDLDTTNNAMSYPLILFTGLRILVEAGPIVSYYEEDQRLGWLPVVVLLLYLFTIVVLLNIMVAQLSDSYQNLQRRIHLNRLFLIVEYERQYPMSIWRDEHTNLPRYEWCQMGYVTEADFERFENRNAVVKPDAQSMVLEALSKLLKEQKKMEKKQKKMEKKLRRIVNQTCPPGGEDRSTDEDDTSDSSDDDVHCYSLCKASHETGV